MRGAVAAVVVIASVGLGAAFSQAGPASADSGTPAGPGGTWGQVLGVPGLTALATAGTAWDDHDEASAVSCTSAGGCTAVGFYGLENLKTHADTSWPMVVTQTAGVWGNAKALPGIAALSGGRGGTLTRVSCASAGNCSAAGSYTGAGNVSFGFLADEVNGTWETVQALPDAASLGTTSSHISDIACPSAGNCAAVGGTDSRQFILNEVDGKWGDPLAIPGLASLGTAANSGFDSVSCPAAGDCTAIGTVAGSGGVQSAVVVTETDGTWGNAKLVPGKAALSSLGSSGGSVSCRAAGDCTAIGGYEPTSSTDLVWVAGEVDGTWGAAQPLAAPVTAVDATGMLSCATPGNCAVVGQYSTGGDDQAFVASEVNGVWQASEDVQGLPVGTYGAYSSIAGAVSCSAPGDCSATIVGYELGEDPAYGINEVDGTWGAATEIPGSNVEPGAAAISCGAPGYCTEVGELLAGLGDSYVNQTLVSEATGTVTTATVADNLTYGDEHAAPVSVTVTSPAGGTPTGTVTVTDNLLAPTAATCTVTLVGGAGQCALPATALPAGKYYLTATYNGDATYAASAGLTGPPALTVAPEATTTQLTLSSATASYGHESSIRLSAVVTPQYGGPFTGTVVIRTNPSATANIACTLTVTDGRGSCLLSDTQLGIGVSHMTAYTSSGGNFAPSVSASHALTTVKGADRTTLTVSKKVVAYGHENEERLSVRVLPAYHGAPAGQVAVKAGSRTLCVISLKSQVGSCVLSARELGVGTYAVVAGYEGNAFFTGSTSGRVSLKVT